MQPPAISNKTPTRTPIKGALKLYFFSLLDADIIPKTIRLNNEMTIIKSPTKRAIIPNPAKRPPKLPTSKMVNKVIILHFCVKITKS